MEAPGQLPSLPSPKSGAGYPGDELFCCSISYANICEHCKVGVAMFRNILVSFCLIMSLN